VFRGASWDEADLLFRRDAYWVGGDGAYSVDLGHGRVLWLFGDTVIDPTGARSRKSPEADMISNTVAIQQGYDPSTAAMRFYWRTDQDGHVAAFFPDVGAERYWPGHGIRIRDRLILFLMRVRGVPTGLGFEVYDWDAVLVHNPDAEPSAWETSWLDTPENDLQVIVGSASVLVEDDVVYAYSSREPSSGDVYLVRWPAHSVYDGTLRDMEWWAGDDGWIADGSASGRPTPVLRGGGTESTVHRDRAAGCYLQVQSVGFGQAVLSLRSATRLTGPWSSGVTVYRPPELDKPRIMIYQGKAHPYLTGADLILSYSTNSFDFQNLIDDTAIYYPRFVRLSRE
jgi:hypothetical protein